jgi:hypothetical protein
MFQIPHKARFGLAIAGIAFAFTLPANAGHDGHFDARNDDPAAVAAKLNEMGFLEWRRLRPDHSVWKVDDARRANGSVYDLKLEAQTLDLVKLEREDR